MCQVLFPETQEMCSVLRKNLNSVLFYPLPFFFFFFFTEESNLNSWKEATVQGEYLVNIYIYIFRFKYIQINKYSLRQVNSIHEGQPLK